jgi:putative oxidoreductase
MRLAVGYGLLAHGLAKASRGPDAFAAILAAIGVPAPHLMSWATIAIEIGGGVAVLLGGFVRLASVPMIAILVVAALTVHLPYGFSSIKLIAVTRAGAQFGPPGYEVDVLYVAALLALVLGGPGPLSIDGVLDRRRRRAAGLSLPPRRSRDSRPSTDESCSDNRQVPAVWTER